MNVIYKYNLAIFSPFGINTRYVLTSNFKKHVIHCNPYNDGSFQS